MEVIGVIILAVVAYIIFMGTRFTNFKAKLMNEFGRRGIPFETADSIYAHAADPINKLHNAGMPVDQIVDRYIEMAKSKDSSGANPNRVVEPKNQGGPSRRATSQDAAGQRDKSDAIVEFVSRSLGIQQVLMCDEEGNLPDRAVDNWSLGYVAGAADAVLQKNGYEPDAKGMALMTMIFMEVFGDNGGPELFGEFMRLQSEGDPAVEKGMMTGGKEVFSWMADNSKPPTGWASYVHGI